MMSAESREQSTLAVLADVVGGRISGDPSTLISGVAPFEAAGPGQITFLANPKLRNKLDQCKASAIVAHPSLDGVAEVPLLLTENPYLAFAKLLEHFHAEPYVCRGISDGADIHPDAEICEDVTIDHGCVVGPGARIGRGTHLHPNVVIYPEATVGEESVLHANVVVREQCQVGNRVLLHPGVVIGSDGFGFAPDGEGYCKIPQVGRVIVEDDVEIGSCTCVDRGTMGDTRIGRGSKIDNLVQIAHNVVLGANCVLVAQVGLAGSTQVGQHCTFGGQSGTAGHLKVGDNTTLAARGGIVSSVDGGEVLAGFPSMPHREWLKMTSSMGHLPEMRREINRLRSRLSELENRLSEEED